MIKFSPAKALKDLARCFWVCCHRLFDYHSSLGTIFSRPYGHASDRSINPLEGLTKIYSLSFLSMSFEVPLHMLGADDDTAKTALHRLLGSWLSLVLILGLHHHEQLSKHEHFRRKFLHHLASAERARTQAYAWHTNKHHHWREDDYLHKLGWL